MEKVIVEARKRWDLGKNGSYRLRKEGMVPAVVYGNDLEPVPVAVERKLMDHLLHQPGGKNKIYFLKLDDKKKIEVLIKDYQLDPVHDLLIHIDFYAINEKRPVQVRVPIKTTGVPVGVKNYGGMLVVLLRDIPVQCLPQDIPENVEIDVTHLGLNEGLKIKDIPLSEKIKIMMDPEINILHVEPTRASTSKAAAQQ